MEQSDMDLLAHHDKISKVKRGSFLIVCKPCKVFDGNSGYISLSVGDSLRVENASSVLANCLLPKDGKVQPICFYSVQYHCVETK